MNIFDECPTECRKIVGAPSAGVSEGSSFVPAAGEVWEIDYASVIHNDTAALDGFWYIDDGVLILPLSPITTLVGGSYLPLYGANIQPHLYIAYLNSTQQALGWVALSGSTAGKTATIEITGRVLRGVL
jgi:hypothetical protein